jgi:hypothetical protein
VAAITWSNTSPADDVTFTSMASRIQSIWTSIATGLNQSLYWQDGSANSDGLFKAETMRLPAIGTGLCRLASLDDGTLILGQTDGFLSETGYGEGGLYHAGSSDTFCVGSPFMQEHATEVMTAPISARWVVRSGTLEDISISTAAITTSVITFGETYSDASEIRVFVQIAEDPDAAFFIQDSDDFFVGVQRVSKETAQSVISWAANADAYPDIASKSVKLAWISEGTVSY